jgi:hypothetical protein
MYQSFHMQAGRAIFLLRAITSMLMCVTMCRFVNGTRAGHYRPSPWCGCDPALSHFQISLQNLLMCFLYVASSCFFLCAVARLLSGYNCFRSARERTCEHVEQSCRINRFNSGNAVKPAAQEVQVGPPHVSRQVGQYKQGGKGAKVSQIQCATWENFGHMIKNCPSCLAQNISNAFGGKACKEATHYASPMLATGNDALAGAKVDLRGKDVGNVNGIGAQGKGKPQKCKGGHEGAAY